MNQEFVIRRTEARIYQPKQQISFGKALVYLFLVLFSLTLTACGASTTQVTIENSAKTTSSLVPTSVPSVAMPTTAQSPVQTLEELPKGTTTSVPAILPTPSFTVPFDQRHLATIDINNPDEIVFVQGYIWVKTDNGHLIQVDPGNNTVVGDIQVDTTSDPSHYCQGLGTDGENIWVCSASGDEDNKTIDVVRIDPQSRTVIAINKVDKIFDQFDMPFLSNHVWVLSNDGDKLVGIDVATNQASPAIDLGIRCFQLVAFKESLLATCALENLLLRIDPQKGEVIQRVPLPNPRNLAATENGVWVLQDNAILRLDQDSLKPLVTVTNLPRVGSTGDIFVTEEAVWVRQESGFLYRIDPVSNELVEQIKIDQDLSGGSVISTEDSVWTTASDDGLLIRLSLQ